MLFSGKITNSFLIFLTRQGADLEAVWDLTDIPAEQLRDPSSWIPADAVEKFLSDLDHEFSLRYARGPLMNMVGQQCNELRAWGALDSVLKLMQSPQDIYSHPHRFLSYFVSPAPPVANLHRAEEEVSFDIPILKQEYPLVTEYLRAVFEALPKYVGGTPAYVIWENTRLSISWSDNQPSFLPQEDLKTNIRPEFVESLVHSLQNSQLELEEAKRRNLELEAALQEALRENALKKNTAGDERGALVSHEEIELIESSLFKMRDYFSRGHQLITLLVKQDRMDPQVREAMRRVDWQVVGLQFPNTFAEALASIRKLKKQNQQESEKSLDRQSLDLNEVVEETLSELLQEDGSFKIDKAFLMDRPVRVDRQKLREALRKVFEKFQEDAALVGKSSWRVITRPMGKRAEIEISRSLEFDTTTGGNLGFSPDWSELEKQFSTEKWSVDVTHHPEVGSSFRLQIPVQ